MNKMMLNELLKDLNNKWGSDDHEVFLAALSDTVNAIKEVHYVNGIPTISMAPALQHVHNLAGFNSSNKSGELRFKGIEYVARSLPSSDLLLWSIFSMMKCEDLRERCFALAEEVIDNGIDICFSEISQAYFMNNENDFAGHILDYVQANNQKEADICTKALECLPFADKTALGLVSAALTRHQFSLKSIGPYFLEYRFDEILGNLKNIRKQTRATIILLLLDAACENRLKDQAFILLDMAEKITVDTYENIARSVGSPIPDNLLSVEKIREFSEPSFIRFAISYSVNVGRLPTEFEELAIRSSKKTTSDWISRIGLDIPNNVPVYAIDLASKILDASDLDLSLIDNKNDEKISRLFSRSSAYKKHRISGDFEI